MLLRAICAGIALEAALVFGPYDVIIRSSVEYYVLDHDLIYYVPESVARKQAGKNIHKERICSYWGGGFRIDYIPMDVLSHCSLFWDKSVTLAIWR
jgi:hypothetical protein